MRTLNINYIIYFYMFICLTLLFFNIAYIFYMKIRQFVQDGRSRRWETELERIWNEEECTDQMMRQHRRRLRRKLKRTDQLIAYNNVMERCLGNGGVSDYLKDCYEDFLALAVEYGTRSAMERAFFAYVISLYHPYMGTFRKQMVNILLKYMDNATVYCRENVLHALYSIGDAVAVEHAFTFLDNRGLYHSSKLISDGLMTYRGDKEELAWRLWRNCHMWNESLVIAVIQFVTQLEADFSAEFFRELQREETSIEQRFAYIRYFQRHVKPELKGYLINCLEQYDRTNNRLAIAASTALGSYPGEDTRQALEQALRSRNWYVRKNSALSLIHIGIPETELEQIYGRSDRYGKEILEYVAGRQFGASQGGEMST